MIFQEKYTTEKLLLANQATEKNKVILSDEAYANGELMEKLIAKLEVLIK